MHFFFSFFVQSF